MSIEVTPEMAEAYNVVVDKGYGGDFNQFLNEAVKNFVEMKRDE